MKKAYRELVKILGSLAIFFIKIYKRAISPLLPCACRYTPTCSEYMIQAIRIHGIWKGGYLGIKRIFRCHPWGGCGNDPVPPPSNTDKNTD